ncbi:hypothetical protein [Treponema zioleckii]|uniref:hypothetical protein n=1 Tax=Treponema zioleckii TaxID=331680 RepID=UPI00168B2C1D|nr:hypothetical protein [Treponema zioleckii]
MPKKTTDTVTQTQTHTEENVDLTREEKIGLGMRRHHFKRVKNERDKARDEIDRLKAEKKELQKQLRALKKEK